MVTPASTPGLIVAAPRSGSGKTTLALGLLRALARRGVNVAGAKCGLKKIERIRDYDPRVRVAMPNSSAFWADGR